MFRAVWPTLDPDAETQVSYLDALRLIPRAVKRRFGFGGYSEDDEIADATERERLDGYTNWERTDDDPAD